MDEHRFDALTRAFGAERSRRGLLKALAASALGAAGVGRHGAAEAARLRAVGNSCLRNSDCASGLCVQESRTRFICHCGSAADCPAASGQCRGAFCQPNGYCGVGVTTGAACDDGNACTTNDLCQADGSCQGTPVVCQASDQCHDAGTCDSATGTCSTPAKPDGTGCDDGNACTTGDACQSGSCVGGSPVVCTPLDECHLAGACDPATGQCSNPAKPDGVACSLGACESGVCTAGAAVSCASNADCPPNACYPGRTCLNGVCDNGLVVKPFNPCFDYVCDPAVGWVQGPATTCDSPGPCQTAVGATCIEANLTGCVYPSLCAACQTCENGACVDNCAPSGVACLATTGTCDPSDGLCHYDDLCGPCATCLLSGCEPFAPGTIPPDQPNATCCVGGEVSYSCIPGVCPSYLSSGLPCCGVIINDTCCNGIDVFGHCCPAGSVAYCASNGLSDTCCDHDCTCTGLGCYCA